MYLKFDVKMWTTLIRLSTVFTAARDWTVVVR